MTARIFLFVIAITLIAGGIWFVRSPEQASAIEEAVKYLIGFMFIAGGIYMAWASLFGKGKKVRKLIGEFFSGF
jgi:uncharacterized membrane protein HdeD (DUF308 family)